MIHALALTGPTASGKTSLSLSLAEVLDCEIISCDSMQIYKEMDIGTAKATEEERRRVPHHLVDFLPVKESYSAEDYRLDAMRAASDIEKRGKLPLFVGGTGLYIDTLTRAAVPSPPSSIEVRDRLMKEADNEGCDSLWQRLYEIDPESALKTHKNNVRRVVRAIEIYELSGRTKSYFDKLSLSAPRDIDIKMITLDFHNRENLYNRVDARVEIMINEGLLDEVSSLYGRGLLTPDTTASQAIGYKEFLSYLRGEVSLEEAKEQLKQSSRRYAKRQLTWFRQKEAYRLYLDTECGEMREFDDLFSELASASRSLLSEMVK